MDEKQSLRGDVAIALLALISVFLMVLEIAGELSPADRLFIERVDLVIAFIFLGEWLWRFLRADRRAEFVRKSWWELLASIPITTDTAQALRLLRVARIVRVIRLLRLIRLATRLRLLAERSERFAGETHLVSLSTTSGVLILGATLTFHSFEFGANPNVASLFDSFWWAMCTVTTVGYGDVSPTTSGGRFVALALMIFGVGVIAAYTALVASYLVRRPVRELTAASSEGEQVRGTRPFIG